MHSLVFQLLLLAAIGLIAAQLARKPSALDHPERMEECINRMHVQNANLRKIVQCLARSANLSALIEDSLWKLDLLVNRLDKLETMQSPKVYVRTPYVHIDDVLKIEGSVANYSCQGKLHVLQAIRRKLEHSHLMNGRASTLFAWPWAAGARSQVKEPMPMYRKIDGNSINQAETASHEVQELSCLIRDAIQRHAKSNLG